MDPTKPHPMAAWKGNGLRELNEVKWEALAKKDLERLNKGEEDIKRDLKGAPWKPDVARNQSRYCTASNPWIAQRLNTEPKSSRAQLLVERCAGPRAIRSGQSDPGS